MNIEEKIIEYLSNALTVPVSADVPKKRPEAFVTVERVGGSLRSVVIDNAAVAIQSWAASRHSASELAGKVDTAILKIADGASITKITRNSGPYNFPPPDSSMSRYQGIYELVFYKED